MSGCRGLKHAKQILFILCSALLIVLFCFAVHANTSSLFEIVMLSEGDYQEMLLSQTKVDRDLLTDALCIEGEPVPYDQSSGTYYVAQSLDSDRWDGRLTYETILFRAYLIPDSCYSNKLDSIQGGHLFQFIVTDGRCYSVHSIVFTGLPILSLTENLRSVQGAPADELPGYLSLFDPDQGFYTVTQIPMTYRLRGKTSKTFSKKPYRVNCYSKSSHRVKMNLLNLGISDEWNLLALYHDSTRLRDMVSLELWNELSEENPEHDPPTDRMAYVELFINNQYMGVYGLTLPLSAERNISANCQALIKAEYTLDSDTISTVVASPEAFEQAAYIKWPKSSLTPGARQSLEALRAYLQDNTVAFEDASYDTLVNYLDLDNAIDHALFYQLIAANDQHFRNNYYSYVKQEDGSLCFQKIPYDLTVTWGGPLFEDSYIESGRVIMEYATKDLMYFDMQALLEKDASRIAPLLLDRWKDLRTGLFSKAHLTELFQTNMNRLIQSGALNREAERWEKYPVSSDLSEVFALIDTRLSYLDGYFEGLEEK